MAIAFDEFAVIVPCEDCPAGFGTFGNFDRDFHILRGLYAGSNRSVPGPMFHVEYLDDLKYLRSKISNLALICDLSAHTSTLLDLQAKRYYRIRIDRRRSVLPRECKSERLMLIGAIDPLDYAPKYRHALPSSEFDGVPVSGEQVIADMHSDEAKPVMIGSATLTLYTAQFPEPCPALFAPYILEVPNPQFCGFHPHGMVLYAHFKYRALPGKYVSNGADWIVERGNLRALSENDRKDFEIPHGYRDGCALKGPDMWPLWCDK